MKMTSGELDQDAAAFDVGRDVQHYLWRIGGKTAALFGHSTQGGALLAACSESQVEALRSYGYNLGMAFQIVDDILDFTGDEAEMGKPAGGDLLEGTITLPALFYLDSAPRENPVRRFLSADGERGAFLPDALSAVVASDANRARAGHGAGVRGPRARGPRRPGGDRRPPHARRAERLRAYTPELAATSSSPWAGGWGHPS